MATGADPASQDSGEAQRLRLPAVHGGGIVLGSAKSAMAASSRENAYRSKSAEFDDMADDWRKDTGTERLEQRSGSITKAKASLARQRAQQHGEPKATRDTPFTMPPANVMFGYLDALKHAQQMEREDKRSGPLGDRSTFSTEAKQMGAVYRREGRAKAREVDDYIVRCSEDGRSVKAVRERRQRERDEDEGADDMPRASPSTTAAVENAAFNDPDGQMIDRERITDFVQKKRDIFLLEYALRNKNEELAKLDEMYDAAEMKLQTKQAQLRNDFLLFQEFLKENDRAAVDAIKRSDEVARTKRDTAAKSDKIRANIISMRNDISKNDDQLDIYLQYANFLEHVAPKEWGDQLQGKRKTLARKVEMRKRQEAADRSDASRAGLTSSSQSRGLASPSSSRMHQSSPSSGRRAHGVAAVAGGGKRPPSKLAGNPAAGVVAGKRKPSDASGLMSDRSPGKFRDRAMSRQSGDGKASSASGEITIAPEVFEKLTLDIDSDEEAELYFNQPRELLDIYADLEERNLSLIQNGQETEEILASLKLKIRKYETKMSGQMSEMEARAEVLKSQIAREEASMGDLKLRMEMFSNRDADGKEVDTTSALEEMQTKVAVVYKSCVGINEANLTPLQMMTAVEARLHELFETMEKMPTQQLEEAERAKDKERRQRLKDEQAEEAKRQNEERMKKALDRARAAPKKQVGRRPVYRSKPQIEMSEECAAQNQYDPDEEENRMLFS